MKVLLIAPNCYPVNGAEEICNIKMLRAMTENGSFDVDVISRKRNWFNYPSDSLESYGVKVNSLTVVESDNRINIKTIWQTIQCFFKFGVTFRGSVWAIVALPYVNNLLNQYKYDFVLTKNSPSFLIGCYLHKKGLKWVASWNDPSPNIYYPVPYGKGKETKGTLISRRIVKLMSQADAHVFPASLLRDHMLYYMKVDKSRTWIAPHVVFPNETKRTDRHEVTNTMRIIHSGNLSSPRDPSTFMLALNEVLIENPSYRIEFTLLGRLDEASKTLLNSLDSLNKHCFFHEPIEYKQSLDFISNYDLACVIEADCGKGGGVFLPTKVTDFMQVGIPIMAVSPRSGVLEGLYNDGIIGYYSDVSNVNSIKEAIKKVYNEYTTTGLKHNVIASQFTPQSVVDVYKQINAALNRNSLT